MGNSAEVLFLDDKVLFCLEILACILLFLPGGNVTFFLKFHLILSFKAYLVPTYPPTEIQKIVFQKFLSYKLQDFFDKLFPINIYYNDIMYLFQSYTETFLFLLNKMGMNMMGETDN